MSDTKYVSSATSLPTLLTVLFVGLKITGYIDWSWWWVLAPTLISAGLGLLLFAVAGAILYASSKK